jgi:hypothetical protein
VPVARRVAFVLAMLSQPLLRLVFTLWCVGAGLLSVGGILHSVFQFSELLRQGNTLSLLGVLYTLLFCVSVAFTGVFAHGVSRAKHGPVSTRLLLAGVLAGIPLWLVVAWSLSRHA